MEIGDRIKEIRESLGMKQVDFADRIGVSKQNLYKYEKGIIRNIPSDKIEVIAKIGNVSPAYIMGWVSADPEGLVDYYNDSIKNITRLLSNSGYEVHYENYSYEPLIVIEKKDSASAKQVCAVYEGDLLSQYEQFRIAGKNIIASELIASTVINTTFIASDEKQLLNNYRKLNSTGRYKVQENAKDLTMIPSYVDSDHNRFANAAHERTDIPYDDKLQKQDDAIMDDDNF